MNRRAFFAALAAPFVARFLPKRRLIGWPSLPLFMRNGRKIGDTIFVRKPPRFDVNDGGLKIWPPIEIPVTVTPELVTQGWSA